MKVIYKYPVGILDIQRVKMPKEAKILKVAEKDNEFFIWALVDSVALNENYEIRVIGTGHPILTNPDNLTHIDSVLSGNFVWHFFIDKS